MVLPVPPKLEQEQIFERVSHQVSRVQQVITRTEREIDLLREYRTRLTADVVTGKLDVREAAANLPDDTDQSEAINGQTALTEGDEEGEETDIDTGADKVAV